MGVKKRNEKSFLPMFTEFSTNRGIFQKYGDEEWYRVENGKKQQPRYFWSDLIILQLCHAEVITNLSCPIF